MDLKNLDDEALDRARRAVLTEQERRQKLAEGLNRIGEAVREYMDAAGLDCPEGDYTELGQSVVDLLVGAQAEPAQDCGVRD